LPLRPCLQQDDTIARKWCHMRSTEARRWRNDGRRRPAQDPLLALLSRITVPGAAFPDASSVSVWIPLFDFAFGSS
jgi:hypothetical protein